MGEAWGPGGMRRAGQHTGAPALPATFVPTEDSRRLSLKASTTSLARLRAERFFSLLLQPLPW